MKVTVICETSNGVKIVMDDRYATVQAIDSAETMPIDVFSRLVFTEQCARREAALNKEKRNDA